MRKLTKTITGVVLLACSAAMATESPQYDAALAAKLGADDYGMHSYVFVLLRTGPADAEITDPEQRQELFAGHFSNMGRLAQDGKLVLAGPLGDDSGKRGIFVLKADSVEAAKAMTAADPTIENGVFIAEYSTLYASAALQMVNELHMTVQKKVIGE